MEAAIDTNKPQQPRKKGHPPGLYFLFLTEAWERFSYYGMRAILVLYLTTAFVSGGLGFNESFAVQIYGLFTMFVYFTPILGGYLTDKYIPRRIAITIGGVIMALGNFTLFAWDNRTGFWIGLALLIIGNGFFKPNISTLVGDLYKENDPRRDSAFTIFYMGINTGALFAPLVVGFLAETYFKTTVNGVDHFGFKYGFLASCIGMILGQVIFNIFAPKYLGDIGTKVVNKPVNKTTAATGAKAPLTKKEKQRTLAIIILTCFVVFFWAGFEQAGSSLTLYTNKFIDRTIFGWEIPTAWFQSVNPLFIILFAPVVSAIWMKLSRSKRGDLKIPTKMGLGMILLGLGFLVLLPAIMQTGSDEAHIVKQANLLFIIVTYMLHTFGELFLSPVGLSMVSSYAPVRYVSLLMGVWLAGSGFANLLAGILASFTESLGYLEVFTSIGCVTAVLGIVLLLLSKKISKMMD
ncbi:peptide MFS transporter [Ectobacillus polymachus]|uniref:peptide MFS transporter n=1 Tax=Ectobacillus polymachus TaxID=1508806 RepID=UPI003A88DE8A